jgi:hypothetical protein
MMGHSDGWGTSALRTEREDERVASRERGVLSASTARAEHVQTTGCGSVRQRPVDVSRSRSLVHRGAINYVSRWSLREKSQNRSALADQSLPLEPPERAAPLAI